MKTYILNLNDYKKFHYECKCGDTHTNISGLCDQCTKLRNKLMLGVLNKDIVNKFY